jgi:predicted lipid-binding transport protein (Tim44 family)
MRILRFRPLLALGAIAAALVMIAADVDAAPRSNFGSRGTRTQSAPPPTQTAPTQARPIERTMTQPTQPSAAARPTTPAAQPGGFFNRPGLLGGLAAGFLGAGLFGLLFGHGLTGGLGGLASILGLVLQVGLVAIVAYLAWTWWQRRSQSQSQPAFAGGPSLRDIGPGHGMGSGHEAPRSNASGSNGLGGGYGAAAASAPASGGDEIGTTPADFDNFERLLGDIQIAYGQEDLGKLRALLTPEMVSYFAEELAANTSRGVVNRVSDVKLLQGDLAEAWREGERDYASVAMRYAINDQMVDRASGRVVEGGPQEATEVWTFTRVQGGAWLLSAIQQV